MTGRQNEMKCLDDQELLEVAVARMEAIERGEEETFSIEESIAEFAPHLRATPLIRLDRRRSEIE